MVCRDRNRLAIMADIIGAYALGIRNMLCLSGDHQKFGNHPESKNVYDIEDNYEIHGTAEHDTNLTGASVITLVT